jgi:hypothetical protein
MIGRYLADIDSYLEHKAALDGCEPVVSALADFHLARVARGCVS